jgi:hypothetical protein
LRLVNEAGVTAWQSAGAVPVGGLYPTNAWRSGEVVTDYHAVPIDPALAPGRYSLQAALRPPFDRSDSGWFAIAPLQVLPSESIPPPEQPLRARFGDQWLLGYDLPETAAPGARVPVSVYWLRGPNNAVTAFGQTRSLSPWPAGGLAVQRYDLSAPTSGNELPVVVETGFTAQCGWLAFATTGCALPPVQIAGQAATEGAVNFSGQLLLRRAEVQTAAAPPGGQVPVLLEWQALQTLSEDYTVFVHLLGPDGLVHGQVDAWPVSGTRATTTWGVGEVIRDPYRVPVSVDAPPGEYQVEIGLYLLSTGQRLAVLNAAGAPVDDRLLLSGLIIGP